MKATSPPNFSKIKKKCPYGCLLSRDRCLGFLVFRYTHFEF
jgi:hypothetical protein